MARQEAIFAKGKIANMIFYYYKGKPCIRIMPEKVKQTQATRKSAQLFGKAAGIAKEVRIAMKKIYMDLDNDSIMQRLNSAMVGYLNSKNALGEDWDEKLDDLVKFNFNKVKPIFFRFRVEPIVYFNNNGEMSISFQGSPVPILAFPDKARYFQLQLVGVAIDPAKPQKTLQWNYQSDLLTELDLEQKWSLPFTNKKGQMILIGGSIRYFQSEKIESKIEKPEWMPAGILVALWTGRSVEL